MKRKALLIGALPRATVGPWVQTADAREWRVDPRDNYNGFVLVEVLTDGGPPNVYPLQDKEIRFSGDKARVVLTDLIAKVPVKTVTVNIEAVL